MILFLALLFVATAIAGSARSSSSGRWRWCTCATAIPTSARSWAKARSRNPRRAVVAARRPLPQRRARPGVHQADAGAGRARHHHRRAGDGRAAVAAVEGGVVSSARDEWWRWRRWAAPWSGRAFANADRHRQSSIRTANLPYESGQRARHRLVDRRSSSRSTASMPTTRPSALRPGRIAPAHRRRRCAARAHGATVPANGTDHGGMDLDLSGTRPGQTGVRRHRPQCRARTRPARCRRLACSRAARTRCAARDGLPQREGQRHGFVVADARRPMSAGEGGRRTRFATSGTSLVNNTGGPPAGPAHAAGFPPTDASASSPTRPRCRPCCRACAVRAGPHRQRDLDVGVRAHRQPRRRTPSAARSLAGRRRCRRELGADGITVNNVLPGYTGPRASRRSCRRDGALQRQARSRGTRGTGVARAVAALRAARRNRRGHRLPARRRRLSSAASRSRSMAGGCTRSGSCHQVTYDRHGSPRRSAAILEIW